MRRYFNGAKAKAWRAERNKREGGLLSQGSDNEPIVAFRVPSEKRAARVLSVTDKAKHGKKFCEHCRWSPPSASILHAHHVIPISCGGADSVENIMVLCPNCHAVAHYVSRRSNLTRTYTGPATPEQLREWMSAAKYPNKLRELQRAYTLSHVTPILDSLRA